MIWLLRDFDLLSVLLRAFTLALEILTLGGVAYLLLVAIPAKAGDEAQRVCRQGIRWAAVGLAVVELCYVAVDSLILVGSSSLSFRELVLAPYFLAGTVAVLAAVAIAAGAGGRGRLTLLLAPLCLLVLGAVVWTSHAASRIDHRAVLAGLTAAHQLGAALWIGAMPFLLLAMRKSAPEEAKRMLRRFSPLALTGAGTLLLGGFGMAWFYVGLRNGSLSGVYGTAYGLMMLAKVYLVVLVMVLGAGNFFLVRRIESAPDALLTRLRRFGEAEIGLAFTAILAASSMTSQPPAVDLPNDRASIGEISARFRPVVPRMTSPAVSSLSAPVPLEQAVQEAQFSSGGVSDANDIAWSEYNHHWAGLIVLAAGAFALLSRLPKTGWAKNWPVVFAALAVFIVLRADPDCWPLGPRPFWASMYAPDVLQHRLYAVLILLFAAFEWGIQTGRLHTRWAALVFPLLCAAGGALLLTHNHSIGNVKEELLAEMSHTPIALLGATAGWSRWLELRLPDRRESKFASYVWPICLMLVGLVLLNYREA